MSRSRRTALVALLCTLVLVAAEGISLLALRLTRPYLDEEIRTTADVFREQSARIRVLMEPDTTRLLALDSILGWRYRANHRDPNNRTNAAALRGDREYSATPKPGVIRVAAFGNSFVYCNEVDNANAWPELVEQMYPQLEVLNYGVGGYGVDQAFLRFLAEGSRLSPQVVLIGFAPVDLSRVVNVYRRFWSNREIPLIKPRYLLDDDGNLVLEPSPARVPSDYVPYLADPRRVIDLGIHDQWYEPAIYQDPLYDYSATVRLATGLWIRLRRRYVGQERLVRGGLFNPASTAFRIQLALFERFAAAVRARGARPIVVLFPDREAVVSARNGQPMVVASLVEAFRTHGLEYADLTAAFVETDPEGGVGSWFMPGGHYSPLANRLVASWLGRDVLARATSNAALTAFPTSR